MQLGFQFSYRVCTKDFEGLQRATGTMEGSVAPQGFSGGMGTTGGLTGPQGTKGVAMDSLRFHLGSPCLTFLRPVGGLPPKWPEGCVRGGPPTGQPAGVFYPFGHSTPYGYHYILVMNFLSQPLQQVCSTFCLPQSTFLFSSQGGSTSLNMELYCTVLTVLYLLYCTYCTVLTVLYLLFCTYYSYYIVLYLLYLFVFSMKKSTYVHKCMK
jgi:hypothetical protein